MSRISLLVSLLLLSVFERTSAHHNIVAGCPSYIKLHPICNADHIYAAVQCCGEHLTTTANTLPDGMTIITLMSETNCTSYSKKPPLNKDRVCFPEEATYEEAYQACNDFNGRLCTSIELEESICCNSGCGYDAKHIWTADECDPGSSCVPPTSTYVWDETLKVADNGVLKMIDRASAAQCVLQFGDPDPLTVTPYEEDVGITSGIQIEAQINCV